MSENARLIAASKAGRRFIAQMKLYNAGDFARLRKFLRSGYYDLVLMEHPVERRLFDLKTTRKLHGRLKVAGVAAADEHHVNLILEGENRGTRLRLELDVSERYPHQIMRYSLRPLEQD